MTQQYGTREAAYQHRKQTQHASVVWRECEDPKRRARLENNPAKWMRHYFPQVFFRPFEAPHLAIIEGATEAIKTGGRFAVAAERGIGKSAIEWCLVLLDAFTGVSPFPAYVPWQASAVKRAFRFWRNALCFNPELLADYPEFCAPFAHSKGVSQRLMATWWHGGPRSGEPTGAQLAISDGMIVLPDSKGCIGSATINGNPRGLNHPTPDGKVMRPTSAILDDVQDRDVAKSARQIQDTISIIDGDVAGMGEAGVKFPMLMSGNCIEDGDVMHHYLEAKNWHGIRIPAVISWPDGWDDGNGETAKLWEEWYELYKTKQKHRDFYTKHKKQLTKGFELSAPGVFKGKREFPSAFCGVIESYYRMGKTSFHAEKQQKPISATQSAALVLESQQILMRAVGPQQGHAIDGSVAIVAGADINPGTQSRLGARITWVCGCFDQHQSGSIMAYGLEPIPLPQDPTQGQQTQACYAALNSLRYKLASFGCNLMLYDARGNWGTRGNALNYASISNPNVSVPCIGAEGWDNTMYRPTHKTAFARYENCHRSQDTIEQRRMQWVAWNADYWNEVWMRAMLAPVGAPGSLVLYSGRHDQEFATQASAKRLMGRIETSRGIKYDWNNRVGDHDYSDAIAMMYVAGVLFGIGTGGKVMPVRAAKRKKAKVNMVNV